MDFKDILTQLDSLKGNEKKPVVEKKTKRPSNMLTESTKSTEVVQPVSKELKLPSLSNIFEELSLEPAKPGAQTIQKDGEPIGSVSNPQVANQMQQAMDKGELTIGQEMTEDEQLHEVAFLAALGPALMTGARVAAPWLAKRGAQMIGGVGKFAGKNPGTTAGVAGGAYVADKAGDAFDAVNDTIDSGKEFASGQVERIVAMGDRAGGMIRNAVGDGAFDAVKATASKYGLPMLAAVALLYGGKKVIDKVLDDDEETLKEAKDWIAGATKNKGAFTKKAKSHGMTTKAFAKKVLANKDDFPAKTEKQANLAKTLGKFDETDTPPEAGIDLTSPISGGNMREGAQYPADDGSPNSTNDEKGNAAANAALAANDSDTPQLVKEKAKGKVSKSSKLPSISKVKSMCSEGLSTSQIKQLHPKCNQQELNIMIKNTKTNLKEGAEHILKAAKHMGKSHGLCKGSYACPHDAGSEGARAYHEGYKTGLDEACGMKNTYEDANDGFSADAEGMGIRNMPIAGMEEGIIGGVGGAMAGSKLGGMAGSAVGGSIGGVPGATIGKGVGAALGGIAGDKMTGDGVFEEGEDEIVDTMASYGAMDEAEFDEGNAFSGALAKTAKGDDFSVGGKTYTKTTEQEQDAGLDDKYDWNASTEGDREATYEDEWTFESLEKELDFHLIEGKDGMPSKSHIMKMCKDGKSKAEICKMHPDCDQGKLKNMIDHCKKEMKSKLDEGYTMSITSGEENQPDRVSVNATDAEADKLIKFVKDVGLGQYGDAEVLDSPGEVADVSFYGSPDASEEPMSSHDDMLKLMGIVDMGNGDFEDEVESPGSCGSDDISVQVDDMDEACGDKAYEDQGYDDKEDESLGMRTGKESGKHQSMKDRRDDSYGKFGKRDSEHREISKEAVTDIPKKDFDQDDEKHDHYGMNDKSHGYNHGSLGGRGDKERGKDSEKPLKFHEDQGYDDKEDESLGMRTGKESGKHQSMKDRRDDSYGKFGQRDAEHRDHKMHEESDAERDDHAERAGREVARDAHYDGRKHSGRDGEDVVKDLEYDDYKDRHHMEEDQGYDDKEDESLGMRTGKESDKKQSMKDRRDDSYGKFGKRDKEDRHTSLEENLRTLDLLAEVGAESSEEPVQPLTQPDDERLLTKEGAEDAPKDSVNDGENEEITETQTDDQREFTVAEDDDLEEGKIPAGLKAYQDKKKGKKDNSEKDVDEACGDMKEEKLDEWANDAGKNGTDTSFEQDIDFMTKVISGGLNKQKSTGQTTIPVVAGQNDRMGYNGADVVKEGSIMSSDGFATILNKLDNIK